jgi:hypothetical protein
MACPHPKKINKNKDMAMEIDFRHLEIRKNKYIPSGKMLPLCC